jgi:hypothetical protein
MGIYAAQELRGEGANVAALVENLLTFIAATQDVIDKTAGTSPSSAGHGGIVTPRAGRIN